MKKLALLAAGLALLSAPAWAQSGGPGPIPPCGIAAPCSVSQGGTGLAAVPGSNGSLIVNSAGAYGAESALSAAQMLPLPSADIYVGNGSGVPAALALSGDCTITNAGAITCPKVSGVSLVLGGGLTTIGASTPTLAFPAFGTPTYTFPAASATLATLGANTFTGAQVVSTASFGLSGAISTASIGTGGVRYANVAATITDTGDSGTVAQGVTDAFGGNTIAASTATTFTEYDAMYVTAPVAGTNTTFTAKYALGVDSFHDAGVGVFGGALTAPTLALGPPANTTGLTISGGSTTGSNTEGLGLSITGTLNTAGPVDGAALFANITNTASGAGSLLADLQVGGASQFAVSMSGTVFLNNLPSIFYNTSLTNVVASAPNALLLNTTGSYNSVGAGYEVLVRNTTGNYNSVGAGYEALLSNTTGSHNSVGAGYDALYSNTTGSNNSVGAGYEALLSNTTGSYNSVGAGYAALLRNTTGNYNSVGAGYDALYSNTTGSNNSVGAGYEVLYSNTTGSNNSVGAGYAALYDLGSAQTAGAFNVGTSYTIASIGTTDFTAIGASSNTVGVVFTATGAGSGTGTATPNNTNNNTAEGYNTGRGIIYGSNNTILGASVTGLSPGLSDAVILATGEGTIRADFGETISGAWTLTGAVNASATIKTGGYTVATLPAAGTAGRRAYVTDQVTACVVPGAALTGGGAVRCPVFDNGTAWVGD